MDVIHLDFRKVFDMVPYNVLLPLEEDMDSMGGLFGG